MAGKNARSEGLQCLCGGVDVNRLPRSVDPFEGLIEDAEDPLVLDGEIRGRDIEGGRWFELGCESSDVVHLGQDAEVLPLDLLRVDLEVVTHLRITRLPESEALTADLVRSQ